MDERIICSECGHDGGDSWVDAVRAGWKLLNAAATPPSFLCPHCRDAERPSSRSASYSR